MQTISYSKFSADLTDRIDGKRIPMVVSIEITYGCNLRCVHCYNPTHKALPSELKTPELYRLIDQVAELGTLEILFTGGEPLVRKDAFDLFFYAKKKGIQPVIFTNATLLTPEIIKQLEDLKPSYISTTIYGWSEEVYEAVTQVPGSFKKFKVGLELLLASDLKVHYKMPVMTLNRHEFETIRDWFYDRNLPFNFTIDISPKANGEKDPLRYRLNEEDSASFRMLTEGNLTAKHAEEATCGRSQTGKVFDCFCGQSSAAISPYGEMNLCTSMSYPQYSLKTGNVREGWKALVEFVDQKPTEKFECTSCEVAPYCTQGAMDGWLEAGDFNACVPYFKKVAKEMASEQ